MSLHILADHLASKGRGDDSVLIHITPRELSGLQSLAVKHGGSLTTNPETGLPEAGFLDSILPAVVGIGGSMMGIPTPLLAIGTGLASAALTGDLGKGIAAGMGAFGGAGLGEALSNAGATAAQTAAVTGGDQAAAAVADQARQAALENTLPEAGGWVNPATQAASAPGMLSSGQPAFYGADASGLGGGLTPSSAESLFPTGYANEAIDPNMGLGSLSKSAGESIGAVSPTAQQYGSAAWEWAKKNPMTAAGLVSAPLMAAMAKPPRTGPAPNKGGIAQYAYNQGYDPTGKGGYFYKPGFTQTGYTKLAAGGSIQNQQGDIRYPQSEIPSNAYAAPTQMPVPQEVVGAQDTNVDAYTGEERFAAGGLASLGGYSDGGRALRGPGDGMSDSIPATINNKQPARLADGEFVVPADVVSHLGNGSTKAGTQQLYSMLDRVRKARTGNKKQGKQINPMKHMPA